MIRGLPALLALAALTGCATDLPDSRPVQPLPPSYFAGPGGTLPPVDWWRRRVEDPALARLIDAGLANSPDLAAAAARIAQARAGLRASEAERLPALTGSGSVTYSRTAIEEFSFDTGGGGPAGGPQIDRERILYRTGVEGSWDADLFGRLAADRRAALAQLDAAGFEAAATRLALVTDIARNYIAARSAAAREQVARENIDTARDVLSVTQSRVKAGLVAGIDAARGESLLAETVALLPPIQAEREARIAALAALTGLPPADIAPLTAAVEAPVRLGLPEAGVPSELLLRRPDIAAALSRVAAANADTASALAQRYPRLSITGTIGLVASALGNLFTGDALGIAAGPALAGPVFDGGRSRARVDAARASADEAVALYRGTVLRAFGEVETSLAAAGARERQRIALERLVAANADTARIARIQYRRGLTDFLGVLDAERALLASRNQLIAVAAEAADAEIALFRAIGGDTGP